MKIAIPTTNNKLCQHFGHCEVFTFFDIDETNKVLNKQELTPPAHVPGNLPPWVAEQGASIILAGGMGARALELFQGQGIKVLSGCPSESPEKVLNDYLSGTLVQGENACDH